MVCWKAISPPHRKPSRSAEHVPQVPVVRSFAPIADVSARVLVLGSMPGIESLRAKQYYAHPRNAFWRVMGDLVGASPDMPYIARTRQLKKSGIALWDVLAACTRVGSLDAAIDERSIIANDLVSFLAQHPRIRHVFFNGATAERCFRVHVQPALEAGALKLLRLPSTSPAHAARSYYDKLQAWRAVLEPLKSSVNNNNK
jgi:TDG/mug DNA glycosylase family protein